MWGKLITFTKESTVNLIIVILLALALVYLLTVQFKKFYKWIIALSKSTGATITDEETETKVNQLLEAFDNLQPYNYNAVKAPLLGISTADFYKIKASFGHHSRGFVLGDVFKGIGSSLFAESLDLNGWLVKELDNEEMNDLRNANPNLPI